MRVRFGLDRRVRARAAGRRDRRANAHHLRADRGAPHADAGTDVRAHLHADVQALGAERPRPPELGRPRAHGLAAASSASAASRSGAAALAERVPRYMYHDHGAGHNFMMIMLTTLPVVPHRSRPAKIRWLIHSESVWNSAAKCATRVLLNTTHYVCTLPSYAKSLILATRAMVGPVLKRRSRRRVPN